MNIWPYNNNLRPCVRRLFGEYSQINSGITIGVMILGLALVISQIYSSRTLGAGPSDIKGNSLDSEDVSGPEDLSDRRLIGHGGPVKAIAISPNGRLALTGSFDYAMMVWDLTKNLPEVIHRFDDHDGAVNAVAFHPDGNRVLSATDDGVVTVWNIQSGKLEQRFRGHQSKIIDIDISKDGSKVASASWDGTVRVWELNEAKPAIVLKGHQSPVNAVVFTEHQGRLVLYSAAHDGTIRRWSPSTGELERVVFKNGWGINVLAIADRKNTLIFGALNGQISILDSDLGAVIKNLPIQERPILSAEFSKSRDFLATGGANGMIRIWNTEDWSLKKTYRNPYGPVWAIAIGDDSKAVYYGGLDDFVSRWQINPEKPFEAIKSKFPRRFQEHGTSLGERQFLRKCSVCHTLSADGANRAGPTLFKLFGRAAGSIKDYSYSKAILESLVIWNDDTINRLFLEGPENFVPGTKMPLQRIKDAKIREALIIFLKQATSPAK